MGQKSLGCLLVERSCLDLLVVLVVGLNEARHLRSEHLGRSVNLNCTFGIVTVLNLHLSVLADVDVRTVVSLEFEIVLHAHVHVERLVGLVLAVRNASLLHGGGLIHGVFHTVEAALLEQEAR